MTFNSIPKYALYVRLYYIIILTLFLSIKVPQSQTQNLPPPPHSLKKNTTYYNEIHI